jgi:hypothetical protein
VKFTKQLGSLLCLAALSIQPVFAPPISGPVNQARVPPQVPAMVRAADLIVIGTITETPAKPTKPEAGALEPGSGSMYRLKVDRVIKGTLLDPHASVGVHQPLDVVVCVTRDQLTGLPITTFWEGAPPDDPGYAGPGRTRSSSSVHANGARGAGNKGLPGDSPGLKHLVSGMFFLKKNLSGTYDFVNSGHPVLPALPVDAKTKEPATQLSLADAAALTEIVNQLSRALSADAAALEREHHESVCQDIVDAFHAIPRQSYIPILQPITKTGDPHARLWATYCMLCGDWANVACTEPRWPFIETVKDILVTPPEGTKYVTGKIAKWMEDLAPTLGPPPPPTLAPSMTPEGPTTGTESQSSPDTKPTTGLAKATLQQLTHSKDASIRRSAAIILQQD